MSVKDLGAWGPGRMQYPHRDSWTGESRHKRKGANAGNRYSGLDHVFVQPLP